MDENNRLKIEATLHDVKFKNSKLGDESWVDVTVRVAGQANIEAAMRLNRAKQKSVTLEFELED